MSNPITSDLAELQAAISNALNEFAALEKKRIVKVFHGCDPMLLHKAVADEFGLEYGDFIVGDVTDVLIANLSYCRDLCEPEEKSFPA